MSDNLSHALSGATGGVLATIVTYPLISISTRAQVEQKTSEEDQSFLQSIAHVIKENDLRALYWGMGSGLTGIFLTNAIYYYFYEGSKALILNTKDRMSRNLSTRESMSAGAVAGSATVILTNPIWVVNTRATTQKHTAEIKPSKKLYGGHINPLNLLLDVVQIAREEGVWKLFSGVGPALILVVNPIIQYTIFEQLRTRIEKTRKLGSLDFFLLGAIGKLFATGSTYPFITMKSRMQVRQERQQVQGPWKNLTEELGKPGAIRKLYRGLLPKLLQSVLTAAFLFMYLRLYAV